MKIGEWDTTQVADRTGLIALHLKMIPQNPEGQQQEGDSNTTSVTVDNWVVTVSASPSAVVFGGSTSSITATVTHAGAPVQGHTVQFSVSGPASPGSVSPASAVTNSSGQATTTYTSGANGGTVTITATDTTLQPNESATCTVKVIRVLTQTESTFPANRQRTTLGIGEKVDCWTQGGIEVNWGSRAVAP
jgi:hypothetical protein